MPKSVNDCWVEFDSKFKNVRGGKETDILRLALKVAFYAGFSRMLDALGADDASLDDPEVFDRYIDALADEIDQFYIEQKVDIAPRIRGNKPSAH